MVDRKLLKEHTITIDCDVIQADGGTRTAAITGAFVALRDAVDYMLGSGVITKDPLVDQVAAISVGVVDDELLLDLNYEEDSSAEVDMNVVMTGTGLIVEVQGTAEGRAFSKETLDGLYDLAANGISQLTVKQKEALGQ